MDGWMVWSCEWTRILSGIDGLVSFVLMVLVLLLFFLSFGQGRECLISSYLFLWFVCYMRI